MVIEILFPSYIKRDLDLKFYFYEEAGILEYWIVSIEFKKVSVYILADKIYVYKGDFLENESIPIHIWEG